MGLLRWANFTTLPGPPVTLDPLDTGPITSGGSTSRAFVQKGKAPFMRDASWYLGVKIKQSRLILSNRKQRRCFNVLLCHHDGKQYVCCHIWEVSQYLWILCDQSQKMGNIDFFFRIRGDYLHFYRLLFNKDRGFTEINVLVLTLTLSHTHGKDISAQCRG